MVPNYDREILRLIRKLYKGERCEGIIKRFNLARDRKSRVGYMGWICTLGTESLEVSGRKKKQKRRKKIQKKKKYGKQKFEIRKKFEI